MARKEAENQADGSIDSRKLTGAFYSPRSLVQFMCQECLSYYLAEATGIPRADMDDLVLRQGINGLARSINDHIDEIDALLRAIRIIDPAAGNGAFLGGMLHEIVKIRCSLSPSDAIDRTIDTFKQEAAEHALYGVDIDLEAIHATRAMLRQACATSNETAIDALDRSLSRNIIRGDALNDTIHLDHPSTSLKTWRTHFSTVFEENGGFDIVISNPPYLSYYSNTRSRLSTEQREGVKQSFKSVHKHNDRINAMNLFIEKGIDLLKSSGTLAYVVNKTVGVLPSYEPMRRFLLGHIVLDYVFTDLDFFDAIVDCTVMQLKKKAPPAEYYLQWCSAQGKSLENESLADFFSRNSSEIPIVEFKKHRKLEFNHSLYESILEKIEQAPLKLRDILTINRGVNIGGCSEHFLSQEKVDARYERIILDAACIGRYRYTWDESQGYFIFDAGMEQELRDLGKTLVLGNPVRYAQDKIFIPEASQALMAAYVPELIYSAYGILVGTNDTDASALKCACALLNSRIFTFYAIERQILRKGKKATPHVGVNGLSEMPVPRLDADAVEQLTSRANQILAITSNEKYLADVHLQERGRDQINDLDYVVFGLYGLDEADKQSIYRATDSLFE
jgi:hypothetical protein